MKIKISPEKDDKFEEVTYDKVFEFALVASRMRGDVVYDPINHSCGDKYILIGRLTEMIERLRDIDGANYTK